MAIKKTLLEDIANELNVSKTLVSMVINGKGNDYGISKKTQEKVLAKASEMEYSPNVFARALRTGKSNLIALIVADISNPFYSNIAKFIEKELADKGYNLMICSTDEDVKREENLISLFAEQQLVDALIIATASTKSDYFKRDKLKNTPIVFIDRYLSDLESSYVVANNYQGSFDVTDLLISKGCKNILTLSITPSYISSIADRIKGHKDALKKHNIAFKTENVIDISFNNIQQEVHNALVKVLNSKQKIDAIYTLNNNLATACLNVFNELNFDAKKQGVFFASFDDISLFDFVKPSIISVAQPLEQIGKAAAELALKLIDDKGKDKQGFSKIVLPTTIISRT
jgi:LacI family transcriptional regulator